MDSPQPLILGVDAPVHIKKWSQENHLKGVISQKDKCAVTKGVLQLFFISGEDDEVVHENQAHVDL